jgi:hypothetical protein
LVERRGRLRCRHGRGHWVDTWLVTRGRTVIPAADPGGIRFREDARPSALAAELDRLTASRLAAYNVVVALPPRPALFATETG